LGADWVIVGTPTAHGVRVIASKNLKPGGEITIVQREDVVQAGPLSAPTLRHDHYRIVALAKDIVIVDGRDYAEALRMLMATWQPPERASEPVAEIFAGEPPCIVIDGPYREVDRSPEWHADAMAALERASQPMSDEERAIYDQMLGEEP
jgi:hypothetical protein